MTTIFERVADALDTLGVEYASGIFIPETGETLPDQLITYSLVSSPPEQHADEIETLRVYRVQITIYDRSGLINLPDINTPLTAAGFVKSNQYQLPYDQETGHHGLATDYIYLEDVP